MSKTQDDDIDMEYGEDEEDKDAAIARAIEIMSLCGQDGDTAKKKYSYLIFFSSLESTYLMRPLFFGNSKKKTHLLKSCGGKLYIISDLPA